MTDIQGKIVSRSRDGGYPIVLTASRSEISQYGGSPFTAFYCTFPEMFSRRALKGYLTEGSDSEGPLRFAPYGLRKVESILADEFGEENVVVSHPDRLDRFVGPNTKLLGITSMDPIGLAYVSTTYNSLIGFGGESLNYSEFKRVLGNPAIRKYRPKVIVGGAGVWQIRDAGLQEKLGIDVLFHGEAEQDLIPVVRRILAGEEVSKYYDAAAPDRGEHLPAIKNAATYGSVEITRGCGRGCAFCCLTNRKMYSFPIDRIMEEVRLNISAGSKSVFTITEDMFLYKADPGFIPNTPEVVRLYRSIASYPGVEHILLSHASFAPILHDPKLLEELTPILLEKTYWTKDKGYQRDFVTVEVGIETGSVRLMRKYMRGKALPFSVDNWPELVCQGVGMMNDYDWWPLCTIMTGQPDETEEDVLATLDLIDDLRAQNAKMFYTPVLFIPLEDAILRNANRASLQNLSELQWMVIAKSWRNNIDFWAPDRAWLYGSMFFFAHWLYARWKHGSKATRPMMHLAGLRDDSIAFSMIRGWNTCRKFVRDGAAHAKELLGLR